MTIQLLIAALVMLIGYRLLYLLHKALPYAKHIKHHVTYIIPILELLSWVWYALVCASRIYHHQNYKGLVFFGVLLVILAIPTFFLMRDFLFGVYLKTQRNIDKGDVIEFDNISGEIIAISHFNLTLLDKHGVQNTIPYSSIRTKIIAKHGTNSNLKKQTLEFRAPAHLKTNRIVPILLRQLLNTPWVAVSQAPFVENISQTNGEYIIQVVVYTLRNEYADKVAELVEPEFQMQVAKLAL